MLPALGFPKAAHLLKGWEYRACLTHGRRVRFGFGEWCVARRPAAKAPRSRRLREGESAQSAQSAQSRRRADSADLTQLGADVGRLPAGQSVPVPSAGPIAHGASGLSVAVSRSVGPTCPAAERLDSRGDTAEALSDASGTAGGHLVHPRGPSIEGREGTQEDAAARAQATRAAATRAAWRGARLGLVVSKRVGSAPVRNRVKRLVREAFRHTLADLPDEVDVVFRAGPRAASLDYAAARLSLAQLTDSLRAKPLRDTHTKLDSR